MPCYAQTPCRSPTTRDPNEERQVHKVGQRSPAPADAIVHAKMVARRWDGLHPTR